MENFSFKQDGATFQKKTDGRKTETFTLDLPNMVNVKSGRSGLVCGLTMKTKETNSGIVINIEARAKATGKFKGKGGRLSDLLDEGGVTVDDLKGAFSMILQHAVTGTFSSPQELLLRVSSLVGKVTKD